jgi:hypothetical protein
MRVSTAPGFITAQDIGPSVRTLVGVTGEWTPADERRHDGSGIEQWSFAFDGGGVAGQVVLALSAAEGRASFLFDGVLGELGRIVVADETVPLPRAAAGLEIRADGLWASLLCETAFEHWSLGLEAFGLRLDDDAVGDDPPAWSELVGERLPVGFDLEWELGAPPEPLVDGCGYQQAGTLFGELLVVRDRIEVEAICTREHAWRSRT